MRHKEELKLWARFNTVVHTHFLGISRPATAFCRCRQIVPF
jgi:hypothetical protein